jgi:hypothetical protein
MMTIAENHYQGCQALCMAKSSIHGSRIALDLGLQTDTRAAAKGRSQMTITSRKTSPGFGTFTLLSLLSIWTACANAGRIANDFWKGVIILQATINTNGNGVVGTGFVISKQLVQNGTTNRVKYLITNKHMIGDWNLADGNISNFYSPIFYWPYQTNSSPAAFSVLTTNKELSPKILLHPNPKVDVVAIVIDDSFVIGSETRDIDIDILLPFGSTNILSYGDQLFALGYPNGIFSARNHYPIAKAGYLATFPGDEFEYLITVSNRQNIAVAVAPAGKIYLVDGLIVGGNSGGPVILPSETRVRTNPETWRFEFTTRPTENDIIGIVSQSAPQLGLAIVYSSDYIRDLITLFEQTKLGVKK